MLSICAGLPVSIKPLRPRLTRAFDWPSFCGTNRFVVDPTNLAVEQRAVQSSIPSDEHSIRYGTLLDAVRYLEGVGDGTCVLPSRPETAADRDRESAIRSVIGLSVEYASANTDISGCGSYIAQELIRLCEARNALDTLVIASMRADLLPAAEMYLQRRGTIAFCGFTERFGRMHQRLAERYPAAVRFHDIQYDLHAVEIPADDRLGSLDVRPERAFVDR